MWSQIKKDLSSCLSGKTYPALRGVPLALVMRAKRPVLLGTTGTPTYDSLFTGGRPDPAKCQAFAQFVVDDTDLQSGIRERGITGAPRVEDWSRPLFRAVTPGKNDPNGSWWFDGDLLDRWMKKYPAGTPDRKQEVLESIRPMLAVSFNWNNFTELQVMRPPSAIPVITGQGSHKPIWSPDSKDPRAQARYEENENVLFIGGYKQVFVPIVNPATTKLHVL